MRVIRSTSFMLLVLAVAAPGAARLQAAAVKHMPLPELVANADRIVRGTVIAQDDATVSVGGGALPATLYRIRVDETLKGSAVAGEVIEVRLLAQPKNPAAGPLRRGTVLQDLPTFNLGRDYLLLLTRPSAVGLSTTVGLKQGLFELRGRDGGEVAVNGANNLGLLQDPSAPAGARAPGARAAAPAAGGPIAYATLANEIRALVAR
jgi:hypothetical protein